MNLIGSEDCVSKILSILAFKFTNFSKHLNIYFEGYSDENKKRAKFCIYKKDSSYSNYFNEINNYFSYRSYFEKAEECEIFNIYGIAFQEVEFTNNDKKDSLYINIEVDFDVLKI